MKSLVIILIAVAVFASVLLVGMFARPTPTPTPTPVPTTIVPAPSPTKPAVITLTAEDLVARIGEFKVGDTVRVSGVLTFSGGLEMDLMEVGRWKIALYRGMFALAPKGVRVTVEGKIAHVDKFYIKLEDVKVKDP